MAIPWIYIWYIFSLHLLAFGHSFMSVKFEHSTPELCSNLLVGSISLFLVFWKCLSCSIIGLASWCWNLTNFFYSNYGKNPIQTLSDFIYGCIQWWNEWLYLPLCWRSLPSCLQITYFGDGRYYEQPSHVSFIKLQFGFFF